MNVRYQIFISSTYVDLKDQRKKVIDELNKVGYIAIGMEQFPAADEEQMDYIKPVIDESDYYIVILKGKYGSLAEDGLSYTEKEFEYARSVGKPTLAFIYKNYDQLTVKDIETEPQLQEKFKAFRGAMLSKKIVRFWVDDNELTSAVKDSLTDTVRRRPAIGWIRGNNAIDPKIFAQLEDLRAENDRLKKALARPSIFFPEHLSHGSDEVIFKVAISELFIHDHPPRTVTRGGIEIKSTWDDILQDMSEAIYLEATEYQIENIYTSLILKKHAQTSETRFSLEHGTIQKFRYQFEALGVIETFSRENLHGNAQIAWRFSDEGKRYVATLNARRRAVTIPLQN